MVSCFVPCHSSTCLIQSELLAGEGSQGTELVCPERPKIQSVRVRVHRALGLSFPAKSEHRYRYMGPLLSLSFFRIPALLSSACRVRRWLR
jgi:hypothetical protein